jgi:hypothetical protein
MTTIKIPKLKPVESSNIEAAGYRKRDSLLVVRFKTGSVYEYRQVPQEVYTNFLSAESKGKYFYRNIRDAYDFEKIEQEANK